MKTFVITLAKTFPATHETAGKPTNFTASLNKAIMCERCRQKPKGMCVGECFTGLKKLHTIRGNYDLWEKRFKEINDGNACLSVREWAGVPYRSKQVEIVRLTSADGIGLQRLIISRSEWIEQDNEKHFCYWAVVDGKEVNLDDLAKNDGFSDTGDYVEWFSSDIDGQSPDKDGWKHIELAIIHFTKFRY